MAKILGSGKSRFKKQRSVGVELPGLGKAGALERRPYRPGMHGQARKTASDYSIQLLEKQKLRYHYGIREFQLVNFVKKAKKNRERAWVDTLVIKLEQRLDNIVFRAQFANSMAAARQLIKHGHVRVNGIKINVSSQVLKIGDTVELTEKGYKSQAFQTAQARPRLSDVPAYLNINKEKNVTIKLVAEPLAIDIPFAFEAHLVTDFYSKVKM